MPPDSARVAELLPLPPATFHILLALSDQDRHGYAIIQDVEARTRGELRLSAGTLYRSIARMVQQGLVTEVARKKSAEDDPRRRYYRLTPFGQAVARAEVGRLAELVRLARKRGVKQEAT
jgi:DNA-binding PadR family transcriptional regulator